MTQSSSRGASASIAVDTQRGRKMVQALDPVTQHHINQAAERLADEFVGIFSQETIARYMAESTDLLGEAKINVFVPVLAHRFARERLRALAQAEGILGKDQPEVLFARLSWSELTSDDRKALNHAVSGVT